MPTRVSTAKAEPPNTAQTSITTNTFNAIAGNSLAVFIRAGSVGVSVSSVSDTAGNTYSLAVSNTGRDPNLFSYYCSGIAGNANNAVTVSFGSGSIYSWAYVIQYSGIAVSSPVDVAASTLNTGVTNITSNAFSTTDNQEVVLVCASQNNFATYTAGTNFSLVDGNIGDNAGNDFGGIEEYITSSSLASYTAHITSSVTNDYTLLVVSFKAAGGGLFLPSKLAGLGTGGPFFQNPLG